MASLRMAATAARTASEAAAVLTAQPAASASCRTPAALARTAACASRSMSSSSSSSSSKEARQQQQEPSTESPQPEPRPEPQQPASPSFITSASALAAQAAAKPLPFLSTAPGFPFPPLCIANAPSTTSTRRSATASTSTSAASAPSSSRAGTSGATASTSKPSSSSSTAASASTARDARIYAERKAIVSEASKGYFHDFHALRAHGGKTWRAPASLIRAERAQWWPDWTGKRLSDGTSLSTAEALRGRVSLVSVLSSRASEAHVESFTAPTRATYDTHPSFQHITINVQLSALRAFLLRLVFNSLRASVSEEDGARERYFLCTAAPAVPERVMQRELEAARRKALGGEQGGAEEEASAHDLSSASIPPASSSTPTSPPATSSSPAAEAYLRSSLCLHNKHVGYVFLVDPNCQIRWAGSAFAEQAEREALRACTGVLLARQ